MESPGWGRKTCVALLRACAEKKDLYQGTRLHAGILKRGLLEESCYIANALVSMYAKCGVLTKAKGLLIELPARDVFSWSAVIAGYIQHGQSEEALLCLEQMRLERVCPDEVTFTSILKACSNIGAIAKGEEIHNEMVRRGILGKDVLLGTALVDMYVKFGSLVKARQVLDELPLRDVVSWNALMAGYAHAGQNEGVINCFEQMQREGLTPDSVSLLCILKAYGNIGAFDKGKESHDQIVRLKLLGSNGLLDAALVDFYIKCGALTQAQLLLEELCAGNLFLWNALVSAYVRSGKNEEAFNCFEHMQRQGPSPNTVTFTHILKACGIEGVANKGQHLHNEIARQGLLENSLVLGNALVDMYAKCGALEKARQVLEELPIQNVISWNALIAGCTQQEQGEYALDFFQMMQSKGISPDEITLTCILKACGSTGAAEKGEHIHHEILRLGFLGKDLSLGNALVDMYVKCGALWKARLVLEGLLARNVVSWNTLLAGYAQHDRGEDALNCLDMMQGEGILPDDVTYLSILKACGSIGAIQEGKHIHVEIARQGLLGANYMLGTALVDMYAKCGVFRKAQEVLEDIPVESATSWNALIAGYMQQGQAQDALDCFEQMLRKGIAPNEVSFTCILQACAITGDMGDQVYCEINRQGLLENNIALGTALVDMYAKCGALANARRVLVKLPAGNVAPWNALIGGYVQQGQGEEALDCYEHLQDKGLSPDEVTYTCILKACGSLQDVEKGAQIHDHIALQGLLRNNIVLGTAVVDMYAKCGALTKARLVLEELSLENVVAWSALIAGYAGQGRGQDALSCFEQMHGKGLFPDTVTLSSVLHACSHSGFLEEGEMYFTKMSTKYGLTPNIEHYSCMVDLFSRVGHFNKAVAVIQKMPSTDHPTMWSSLLGACQKWGEVDVGKWAFEQAIQVSRNDAAPYICMANIYTAAGMQEKANAVEASRVKFTIQHERSYNLVGGLV